MSATNDMVVANTILEQLGGGLFTAMTGAKNYMGDADSLQFAIGRGAKGGCTHVKVLLAADDTYTATFYRVRKLSVTTLAEVAMVYADSLRQVFTSHTGFATSI